MSVTRNAAGWTVITPSADSQLWYVDSVGGNDSNLGTQGSPFKTIGKAYSLLRDGFPDWMLWKQGGTSTQTFQFGWLKSGRSLQEPMVFCSYGTGGARPIMKCGPNIAFQTIGTINYLALLGIEFYANTRDPASPDFVGVAGDAGLSWNAVTAGLIVENCKFSFFTNNISITGPSPKTNIQIRRNIIVDAYATTVNSAVSHAQGIFAVNTQGMLIEENILDHNGWNENGLTSPAGVATVFNQGVYLSASIDGNTNCTFRSNTVARSAATGCQARTGGVVDGNLFIDNPVNLTWGFVNGSPLTPGGVVGSVTNNVIIGSHDIAGDPRGVGIQVGNVKAASGAIVSGNIVSQTNQTSAASAYSVGIGSVDNPSFGVGVNDITFSGNIAYKWNYGFGIDPTFVPGGSGNSALNNLTITGNNWQACKNTYANAMGAYSSAQEHFSNGIYSLLSGDPVTFLVNTVVTSQATWTSTIEGTATYGPVGYSDPDRNIATYNGSLGGTATMAAYLAQARLQSKDSWNTNYTAAAANAYIQAGFDVTPPPPTPPGVTGATISNVNGQTVTVTSDQMLSGTATGFTATINAAPVGLATGIIAGTHITLSLPSWVFGSDSVGLSWSGSGVTNTNGISLPDGSFAPVQNNSPFVAATGFIIAGPASGTVGATSTQFTAQTIPANSRVPAPPVHLAPLEDSLPGNAQPELLTFGATDTAQSFTDTPQTAGNHSISAPNDGGLTDAPAVAYFANPLPPPPPPPPLPPPTALLISGPTQGTVGVISSPLAVTLSPSGTVAAGPLTITVTMDGSPVGVAPSIIPLIAGDSSKSFTLTAQSAGSHAVLATATGLTAGTWSYLGIAPPAPTPPPATGFTISGPVSGTVGVASTPFTISTVPSGSFPASSTTVTTFEDGLSGDAVPTSIIFGTSDSTKTFAVVSQAAGAHAITIDNDKSLTNPAVLTYTAVAPPPPPPNNPPPIPPGGYSTTSDAIVVIPIGPVGKQGYRHLQVSNFGAAPGFCSVDQGHSWFRVPVGPPVAYDHLKFYGPIYLKRVTGGDNMAGVFFKYW